MRHAAGMARRAPAGKACDCKIEAAPEEMHRACLAEEAGAELLEDPVGIHENLQKAPHRGRIVGCMFPVLRKPDRFRQFVGRLVDSDVNAEVCKVSHDSGVEARYRLSGQCQLPPYAVAGGDPQDMIDEVEIDLEGPRPIGIGEVVSPRAVTYSATCQE